MSDIGEDAIVDVIGVSYLVMGSLVRGLAIQMLVLMGRDLLLLGLEVVVDSVDVGYGASDVCAL